MKTPILIAAIFFSGFTYAQENPKKDLTKTQNIKEVNMTKKVFKKESDRFVYDVAASPVAKGNTAFNLLKETPLVSTTDEKNLKIAGKSNAIIYINGRKTQMDADALVAFLKNTPAENIQKIEVITMPGSEYQVESSDGIINIILKKKMDNGLNGNLRMTNNQGYFNNPGAGVSINYRKDKLGVSANFNTNEYTQAQKYKLRNGNDASSNESEGMVIDPNKNYGGYLNIDYALNEKSNLALSYNVRYNKSFDSSSDLFNKVRNLDEENQWQTSYNKTFSRENAQSINNSVNLNYELKTDSLGSKLNFNAAYLNYHRGQNSTNTTLRSDELGNTSILLSSIVQSTPQTINNFSGMIDYIKKFENDFTISLGGNFYNTRTDNDSQANNIRFNPENNNYLNSSTPNHFIYNENIYAAYVTLEKKFSDKFSGKAGFRYEFTDSKGESSNAIDPNLRNIDRKYSSFLPYVSANYAINKNNNISYSFSSRVRRPSFWELNPVRTYLTEFNYIQNNPFVKASSTYNQELTYMFKNSYFLILGHKFFKDVIQQVPLQREKSVTLPVLDVNGNPVQNADGSIKTYQTNINELRYIRTNFGNKQEFNIMVGMQKSFLKQYVTSSVNIGVQRNVNKGTLDKDPLSGETFKTYVSNLKSNSFIFQTNNNIRLDKAKTWFAGVNYWYVDKQQIELGTLKALGSLDLSLKKILDNWTFMASVSDVLGTNKIVITDYQQNGNYNYVNQNPYSTQLDLSITYNFGNQKVKKTRNIDSAVDDIKNRTR